jgi:hypothetical protein
MHHVAELDQLLHHAMWLHGHCPPLSLINLRTLHRDLSRLCCQQAVSGFSVSIEMCVVEIAECHYFACSVTKC